MKVSRDRSVGIVTKLRAEYRGTAFDFGTLRAYPGL